MTQLKHAEYRPRLVDDLVDDFLSTFGAVQIDGPKYCGKTWTAEAHAGSAIHLDRGEVRRLVEADPQVAIVGEQPRLIDEWQEIPSLRDAVRGTVDETGNRPGQFLLTGSSTPPQGSYVHSGAGRIARVHMRPMSLSEMGLSDGRVSLGRLFEGDMGMFEVDTPIEALARMVCRGGWPAALGRPDRAARLICRQCLESVCLDDAPRLGKSASLARRAIVSLARNNGTAATRTTLARDMAFGETSAPSLETVDSYLDLFRDMYLIEELPGWDAPLRSKKHLRTKPKRYFVDPSLAVAALGADERALLGDLQTFGLMFENLCLRDLRVLLDSSSDFEGATLGYYRDDTGLEADVIIQMPDRRWAAVEVKLSENKVDEGMASLLRVRDRAAANGAAQIPPPSFLAVLVGRTSYARRTREGVFVVPVTSLGT